LSDQNEFADHRLADYDNHRRQGGAEREHNDDHLAQRPTRYEYRLTPKGLALYPIAMSIVHWGDVRMSGRKGRPLLHMHDLCGKDFDPVMVCSKCGEPVVPKQVHFLRGPGETCDISRWIAISQPLAVSPRRRRRAEPAVPPSAC
jgi:hypothetical protein